MTGTDLKTARSSAGWTQRQAAQHLGVTQAYLSMLEREQRPVTPALAQRAASHLRLAPTSLPFTGHPPSHFEDALGVLGYPGFAYIRTGRRYNPAELLLLALDTEDLPARAIEGLPWLPLAFPNLNWEWLLREAKLRNRQNRLGYILELSQQAGGSLQTPGLQSTLSAVLAELYASRLANEDTLCHASMIQAERQWQRSYRPEMAVRWNLLTHLRLDDLTHVTYGIEMIREAQAG
jgi:transcriptional regulator with XRE-family HTH domain